MRQFLELQAAAATFLSLFYLRLHRLRHLQEMATG